MSFKFAAATVMVAVAFIGASTGVAAAAPAERSFPGCPMLSENNSSGPCVKQLQNDLNTINPGYKPERRRRVRAGHADRSP